MSIPLTVSSVTGMALTRAVVVYPGYLIEPYPLYSQFVNSYFAVLESNLAVIVICLPALSQLFRRISRSSRNAHDPHAAHQTVVRDSPDSPPRNRPGKQRRSPVSEILSGLSSRFQRTQPNTREVHGAAKSMEESRATGEGSSTTESRLDRHGDSSSQDAEDERHVEGEGSSSAETSSNRRVAGTSRDVDRIV